MRSFHNSKGVVFARLSDDGTLHKSENQKDRLRVTGGKAHAIDVNLLDEALQAGGRLLEITEKGISGEVRVFRIPLEDIRRYGKRLTLAGVDRWTVPLAACKLVRGEEERWRLAERELMLRAAVPKKKSRSRQQLLFPESGASDLRLSYET